MNCDLKLKLHGINCFIFLLLLIFSFFIPSLSDSVSISNNNNNISQCQSQFNQGCFDETKSLRLKLIAIASILVSSVIGVCLPMLSRAVPSLQPDGNPFAVVKAFSSGVILATGFMHVLPDSFYCLTSPCLPKYPWSKFPFTTFVAMLSALFTLMVDSFSMSYYRKCKFVNADEKEEGVRALEKGIHDLNLNEKKGSEELLRRRVVAQVLEAGIVVHSVVIGLSMGTSNNPCIISPLIAALCFHQLFEGMGLGGCILQAEYGKKIKGVMVLFFSITTPMGIALGIGLSKVYNEKSPTALIVVGILNASSAGLLIYMALVDLLASDFMGPKLQANTKLQIWCYFAVLLGCGGMSVMALWA